MVETRAENQIQIQINDFTQHLKVLQDLGYAVPTPEEISGLIKSDMGIDYIIKTNQYMNCLHGHDIEGKCYKSQMKGFLDIAYAINPQGGQLAQARMNAFDTERKANSAYHQYEVTANKQAAAPEIKPVHETLQTSLKEYQKNCIANIATLTAGYYEEENRNLYHLTEESYQEMLRKGADIKRDREKKLKIKIHGLDEYWNIFKSLHYDAVYNQSAKQRQEATHTVATVYDIKAEEDSKNNSVTYKFDGPAWVFHLLATPEERLQFFKLLYEDIVDRHFKRPVFNPNPQEKLKFQLATARDFLRAQIHVHKEAIEKSGELKSTLPLVELSPSFIERMEKELQKKRKEGSLSKSTSWIFSSKDPSDLSADELEKALSDIKVLQGKIQFITGRADTLEERKAEDQKQEEKVKLKIADREYNQAIHELDLNNPDKPHKLEKLYEPINESNNPAVWDANLMLEIQRWHDPLVVTELAPNERTEGLKKKVTEKCEEFKQRIKSGVQLPADQNAIYKSLSILQETIPKMVDFENRINEATQELDQKNREFENVEKEIYCLQLEMAETEKLLEKTNIEKNTVNQQIKQLSENMPRLLGTIDTFRENSGNTAMMCEEYESTVLKIGQEFQQAKDELAVYQNEISHLRQGIEKIESQLAQVYTEDPNTPEMTTIQRRIAQLNPQGEEVKNEEIAELEKQCRQLQEGQSERINATVAELEGSRSKLWMDLENTENNFIGKNVSAYKIQHRLSEAQTQLGETQTQLDQLQNEHQKARDELREAQENLEEEERKLVIIQNKMDKLSEEIVAHTSDLSGKQKSMDSIELSWIKKDAQKERLQDQLDDSSRKVQQAKNELIKIDPKIQAERLGWLGWLESGGVDKMIASQGDVLAAVPVRFHTEYGAQFGFDELVKHYAGKAKKAKESFDKLLSKNNKNQFNERLYKLHQALALANITPERYHDEVQEFEEDFRKYKAELDELNNMVQAMAAFSSEINGRMLDNEPETERKKALVREYASLRHTLFSMTGNQALIREGEVLTGPAETLGAYIHACNQGLPYEERRKELSRRVDRITYQGSRPEEVPYGLEALRKAFDEEEGSLTQRADADKIGCELNAGLNTENIETQLRNGNPAQSVLALQALKGGINILQPAPISLSESFVGSGPREGLGLQLARIEQVLENCYHHSNELYQELNALNQMENSDAQVTAHIARIQCELVRISATAELAKVRYNRLIPGGLLDTSIPGVFVRHIFAKEVSSRDDKNNPKAVLTHVTREHHKYSTRIHKLLYYLSGDDAYLLEGDVKDRPVGLNPVMRDRYNNDMFAAPAAAPAPGSAPR